MIATPVSIDGWSLNKVLGSGGFGIVELWVHTSGTRLASKKCKWDIAQLTETQQNRWINEVEIMKRLRHRNIIKALELPFKHPDEKVELPILCMEYCGKGDLRKVLNRTENCCGVIEKEALKVMRDISSAVEYLHSNNITHRDLKPENIVLQESDNISYKLIDLGYAKELGEASASASIVGTLNYVAPELFWREKYSCSVDYWSLGILFYELVTGTRPFLPRMQHTMTWMQHIKNKGYNDICAIESDGKTVFGEDIIDPTHLSRCVRNKLVEWFRVVLQWNPKERGKRRDENGELQLVVFKLLQSILYKQIIYVFSASTYKINVYEIDDTTTITDLQSMIEKDTNILMSQQILTDYFGKVLAANEAPHLSQIQDPVFFVFKIESPLMENIPVPDIPEPVKNMMELSRSQLDYETLKDYYRVTIFFLKREIHLFQLYIFALTIKVDLVVARFNRFNENITNALMNIRSHLNELPAIRAKWEKEAVDKERLLALGANLEKVTKLFTATDQIQSKFNPLLQDSNELKGAAQSIDCMKDMSRLYNNAVKIFELCKTEHFQKSGRPTDMVKLVFEFLQVQGAQFRNKNISEVTERIGKLEVELSTLEGIFDSVTVMTTVYREELRKISQCIPDISSKNQCPNSSAVVHKETANTSLNNNSMETSNESCSKQSSNVSGRSCNAIPDAGNDVIYDNLVIRYMLDNLLTNIQKIHMKMINLDP